MSPTLAELIAMSEPIPCDPSRGHRLILASWKVVDGGVVEWRYQAFCRCCWSQRGPVTHETAARKAYELHLS